MDSPSIRRPAMSTHRQRSPRAPVLKRPRGETPPRFQLRLVGVERRLQPARERLNRQRLTA